MIWFQSRQQSTKQDHPRITAKKDKIVKKSRIEPVLIPVMVRWCSYIFEEYKKEFKIGYSGIVSNTWLENLLSARKSSFQVSEAIQSQKELERGHTSGPFQQPPFKPLHCSPVGAVTKKDGSCRFVMDPSQPSGSSIEEDTEGRLFSTI